MAKQWNEFSPGQRRTMVAVAAVETALKTAMLLDLRRRSPEQVRGPRWLWASSALVNSAGVLPLAYFLVGRVR